MNSELHRLNVTQLGASTGYLSLQRDKLSSIPQKRTCSERFTSSSLSVCDALGQYVPAAFLPARTSFEHPGERNFAILKSQRRLAGIRGARLLRILHDHHVGKGTQEEDEEEEDDDGEDAGEDGKEGEGEEESDDDMQLAWENLEVARQIYHGHRETHTSELASKPVSAPFF